MLCLFENMVALSVLCNPLSADLLPGSARRGRRRSLPLSGNGGVDIPEPRPNQGLPVVDASHRRFAPSPPAWTRLAANVRPDTGDGTLITPGGA